MQPNIMCDPDDKDRIITLRDTIREFVGRQNYNLWFESKLELLITGDSLTIIVSSPFEQTWVQRQFGRQLHRAVKQAWGPSAGLEFQVRAKPAQENSAAEGVSTISLPLSVESGTASQSGASSQRKAQTDRDPLTGQTRRLLSEFVVGPENELAFTVCSRVSEYPGQQYNPLVIYGGVGTGKTHLLDGIYWSVRKRIPQLNVLRMTAETFANFFSQALCERKLPAFRHKMRSADLLLLDDIEFLDGKKVFQEEFLHTIKKLEDSGKQMVFTTDRHPRLMEKSREEMTSRLSAGMLCRLETPSQETRLKIVKAKTRRMGMGLTPEIQDYVASRFSRSVRELEGALNCLQHAESMNEQRLTLNAARTVLSDLEKDCRRLIHLSDIERCVCRFFGLQPEELKSKSRKKTVSHPRMLAMFLSRKLTQSPYSAIGDHFGGRSHSTVVSAENSVENWLEESRPLSISSREWSLSDVLGTLERELEAS
ncbi:MAG: chromosomal replication initiator protein DnaA [Planctomycetaceae bacterium]|jgi:chromosomal replication initiator protein|nr:chromosomal replication initiator protein DnaA [Planctomycetaceae bacterium]